MKADAYPANAVARTRWIIDHRPEGNAVDPAVPYAFLSEKERMKSGTIGIVSTVFLTNRECPWKCLMCDLWRNTTPAPRGSIRRQIEHAFSRLPPANILKLYNSGSFFDRGAIPREDWNEIIELCRPFERLIVECHPKLVGPGILDFAARLEGQLEIAMGLETAHPEALEKLNKRITVEEFRDAARFLQQNGIAVRAFLLVGVPFIRESEQQCWMKCSIDIAFDSDAEVVSLIPTRNGNGAMDALAVSGDFREPALAEVEEALEYGVALGRGRVFADTWELARFSRCAGCADARRQRIERMNLHQRIESRIQCPCEG